MKYMFLESLIILGHEQPYGWPAVKTWCFQGRWDGLGFPFYIRHLES